MQYELADGVLLVHQQVSIAPLDFQPTLRRSLQPDVLVVRREDLNDGAYVETAHVEGDAGADLAAPFPVRVVPSSLFD